MSTIVRMLGHRSGADFPLTLPGVNGKLGFVKKVQTALMVYIPKAKVASRVDGGVDVTAVGLANPFAEDLDGPFHAVAFKTTETRTHWFANNSRLHRQYHQKRGSK